ncbi:MAG TPA: FecR domain-containing protein [Marinagarivorans sp.]
MYKRMLQSMRAKRARHWFIKLHNEAVTGDELYAFNRWLEAEPNALAYQQLERTWQALGALRETKEGELLTRHANSGAHSPQGAGTVQLNPWYRWRHAYAAMAKAPARWVNSSGTSAAALVSCACIAVVLFIVAFKPDAPWTEYSTAAAETRELTIADGSHIILTPQTRIKVQLGNHSRNVQLLSGHAFFDVANDAGRPFSVAFKQYSVLVTGTVFGVNTKTHDFKVSVDEGQVAVRVHQQGNKMQQNLNQGQSITASDNQLGDIQPTAGNQLTLWKSGILVYRDTPLRQILAETNSYTLEKVFASNTKLGDTKISLSINISELGELPAMLEELLPVKAVKSDYRKVVLIAR